MPVPSRFYEQDELSTFAMQDKPQSTFLDKVESSYAARGCFFRSLLVDLIAAAFLTIFYHRALLSSGIGSHLIDHFDHKSFIWALEWLYHSTFGSGQLTNILNTNIFFPNNGTLAWSDMLFGFIPIYNSIRVFTSNPILALNLLAVSLTFASCLAMLRLGRTVTGGFSLIAPLVGSIGLISSGQEGHIQMKTIAIVMWMLITVLNYIRSGKPAYLLITIALFGWLFTCSVYLSLITFYFGLFATAIYFIMHREQATSFFKDTICILIRPSSLVVIFLTAAPCLFTIWIYLQAKSVQGLYSLEEAVVYSGRIFSLFDPPDASFLYAPRYSDWGSHEAKLMLGVVAYFMAFLGLCLPKTSKEILINGRSTSIFLAVVGTTFFVLALGPYEKIAFAGGSKIPLPGWLFWNYLPGFAVLRVAGRFGLFAAIFFALLAELGVKRFLNVTQLSSVARVLLVVFIFGITAIEQLTVVAPYPTSLIEDREFYAELGKQTSSDAALVELPLTVPGHFETLKYFIDQELASTLHWRRLLIGYSSKSSAQIPAAVQLWSAVESGPAAIDSFYDYLSSLGITHLVLDRNRLTPEIHDKFEQELKSRGANAAIFQTRSKELWQLIPQN